MGPAGAPRRSRTAMIRGLPGLGHGRRRAGVLVLVLVVLVVLAARGGDCLRNVNLSIQPSAVERGKQARLVCDYDLEGENLYSVKWYRGVREIFRYTTSDKGPPRTNVFPLPGVNVDLSLSNATQLMLTNVGLAINGNVSCEVTTDKPRLMMAQSNAYMTVVALPRSPPKLWTHRSKYDLGDRLIANCTAPPSNPAAQLTFQINNRTVPSADTAYQLTSDREQWSALSINMPLSQHHFQAGRLTLQCTASLTGGFALKSEALELGVRPSEPVPERVTSSSCSRRARVALVLALLGVLCVQR